MRAAARRRVAKIARRSSSTLVLFPLPINLMYRGCIRSFVHYVTNILQKLQVRSRVQAALYASRRIKFAS